MAKHRKRAEADEEKTLLRMAEERELTGEEQALYDRQIRLWGVEAQRRLSTGHVLIVGAASSGLAQEVAKNVVLAGVGRVTLWSTIETKNRSMLGMNVEQVTISLREMNPLVTVETGDGMEADVILGVGLDLKASRELCNESRKRGVPCMLGRTAGVVGWIYFDLGEYEYISEDKSGRKQKTSYAAFDDALEARWGGETRRGEFGWHAASVLYEFEGTNGRMPGMDDKVSEVYGKLQREKKSRCGNESIIQDVAKCANVILPAVEAIVGGVWGREVVKVLSRREEPIRNFFFYNARTSAGSVECITGPFTLTANASTATAVVQL